MRQSRINRPSGTWTRPIRRTHRTQRYHIAEGKLQYEHNPSTLLVRTHTSRGRPAPPRHQKQSSQDARAQRGDTRGSEASDEWCCGCVDSPYEDTQGEGEDGEYLGQLFREMPSRVGVTCVWDIGRCGCMGNACGKAEGCGEKTGTRGGNWLAQLLFFQIPPQHRGTMVPSL